MKDIHDTRKERIEDAMIEGSPSIVHLMTKGYGLTVCCKKTIFELPKDHRLTMDRKRCTCHNRT